MQILKVHLTLSGEWSFGKKCKNLFFFLIFRLIHNMYRNIRTYIRQGREYSAFVSCDIGVIQGKNQSPYLFSLLFNDLETFFLDNDINSLEQNSEECKKNSFCT